MVKRIVMKIIYEIDKVYKIYYFKKEKNKWVTKKQETLHTIDKFLNDNRNIFLLKENKFRYYCFTYFNHFRNKVDITKLNSIVNKKINEVRNIFSEKRRLLYVTLDNIIVNWEKKKFILWESGDIFFDLRFFYIEEDVYDFFYVHHKDLLNKSCIWPKSFFTIKFLNENLQKREFYLLYFFDETILKIEIKNWFYYSVKEINFWFEYLKSILKERWLDKLYYYLKLWRDISNQYSRRLLKEVLEMYIKYLFNWFVDDIDFNVKDVIIIGSNKIRSEVFINSICQIFKWFNIIPFNYSRSFEDKVVGKILPIDVQAFLFFKW